MTGYRRNARDQQNVHLTPLPASFPHPPTAICALAKERGNGSCMLDIPAESLANPPRRGEYRNAHTALPLRPGSRGNHCWTCCCLLYTSDAADDLLCVDLGGRRIINNKKTSVT